METSIIICDKMLSTNKTNLFNRAHGGSQLVDAIKHRNWGNSRHFTGGREMKRKSNNLEWRISLFGVLDYDHLSCHIFLFGKNRI